MIAARIGLMILGAASVSAASAHDLGEIQQGLFGQEQYFQIIDQPAPDFTLQDAEGNAIGLQDFRGKAVVLHFIYTNCTDFCPLHAEKIAEIQEMVNISPMRERVQFITITTDPLRDTPDILRSYGTLHGLDSVNWVFLTSGPGEPEDTTRRIAEQYGLQFTLGDEGVQMHGVKTIVIGREGIWRGSFHGLDFNPTNLVVYVNALVNDVHAPDTVASSAFAWRSALIGAGALGLAVAAFVAAKRRARMTTSATVALGPADRPVGAGRSPIPLAQAAPPSPSGPAPVAASGGTARTTPSTVKDSRS